MSQTVHFQGNPVSVKGTIPQAGAKAQPFTLVAKDLSDVALSQFAGNRFVFISPEDLRLPQYVKNESLEPTHQIYKETADLEAELPHLDVLYMTRIQQERFFNEEEYLRLKGCYQLDEALLQKAPQDMPVLHPLPRIDEIKKDVDDDPRAAYFDQVHNGVYIRMAIILALLDIPDPVTGKKVLEA